MNQNYPDLSRLSKKEKRQYFKELLKQNREGRKRSSWLKRLAFGLALILLIVGFGYFWLTAKPSVQSGSVTSGLKQTGNLQLGSQAPNFNLPSADGKMVTLSDYLGENVLLFFQEGVACQPCWEQIGTLEAAFSSFEKINTKIVTIGVDPASDWRPILQSEGVKDIPVLIDSNREMSKAYGVLSMPSQMHSDRPGHTFILINKEGRIAWIADYPTMRVSNGEILSSINEALKKQS